MQPVARKWFSIAALTLGDLILMMREDQILTAGMNIDLFSQIFFGHHRTLDMPSRTAVAPGRLPGGLSFFFRFPENEIQRIFLLIFTSSPEENGPPLLKIIQIFVRQLSVFLRIYVYGNKRFRLHYRHILFQSAY